MRTKSPTTTGRSHFADSPTTKGICEEGEAKETTELVPISEYNKTKLVAERVALSYAGAMDIKIVRPATVCGYSPRMRLDVMVNSFVMQAMTTGIIRYNGGEQFRPNIHIEDMADLYCWLLQRRGSTEVFNAGFENLSIH